MAIQLRPEKKVRKEMRGGHKRPSALIDSDKKHFSLSGTMLIMIMMMATMTTTTMW
jgi:hypothetical protein